MKNTFTLLTFKKWNRHLVRMIMIVVSLILISMSGFTQITAPNVSRCGEGEVTLNATTELTGGALTWYDVPFYGTPITTGTDFTTPVLQESTTFYVDYVVDGVGVCNRKPVKVTINNTTVTANIYYSSVTYCNSLNQIQEVTNSGSANGVYSVTPSSPLVVNASSGTFNPFGITPGDYTITYTIPAEQQPAGCSEAPINTTITIVAALATPVIDSFTSPLCNSGAAPFNLTLSSGPSGGTWSASPNGLNITTAGLVTLAGSSPGNYTITYTKAGTGGCVPQNANAFLTITGLPTASISYSGSPFCNDITSATPTLTGTGAYTGGAYSYTGSGLASFSTSTGAFDPSTSTAGTYIIKYTAPASAGCAAVEVTTPVTVNVLPTASITGGTTVCMNDPEPKITFTGVTGTAPFTFTYKVNNGADRFVVTSSGNTVEVPQATVSAGTFIYTLYSVSDANGCSQAVSGTPTQTITVTGLPVALFQYPSSLYCTTGTATPSYINGGVAGAFTSLPAGLSIASETGVIDVAASTSGTYTVTNTVSACGAPVVANVTVTINHVNPVIAGGDDATCGSTTLTANSGATNATYIWYKNNEAIEDETASTFEVDATDNYKVQVTNTDTGCAETSASKTVTINPLPDCSISGLTNVTYGTTNIYTAASDMSTYAWSITGDGTISGAVNTSSVEIVTSAAGVYTLSVTVTNNGCTSTCNQAVYVDKKELTVTATGPAMTYGTALNSGVSAINFTSSGEIASEAVTSVTLTPDAAGLSATTAAGAAYAVTPSLVTGSGGFLESNYVVTYNDYNGTVGKRAITLTAAANTKTYDGDITAAAFPTITTGTLASGDVGVYSETYDTKTQGSSKTMTPAVVSIKDVSNADMTGNYTVTLTTSTNGQIDKRAITLTAVANTKTYDGNINAIADPTLTGTLATGDVAVFYEKYETATVGTGKTMIPVVHTITNATIPMETNYAVTLINSNNGEITAAYIQERPITGITAPATGGTPVTDATNFVEYSASVSWSPALDVNGKFVAGTIYTATITITPTPNYTLTGVPAGWFTVAGATANNDANSGVVTAVFQGTVPDTPTGPASQSFCSGETVAQLKSAVTGTTGTLTVYDAATDGNEILDGIALTERDYYVSQTVNTVESVRLTVAVTITSSTNAPIVTSSICPTATQVTGVCYEADGTTIEVFVDGISEGTTTVSTQDWTLTGLPPFTAGQIVTAMATATGKCESAVSNSVIVATTAAPTVTSPINNGATSVSGTSEANANVVVFKNGSYWYNASADASGNWSVTGTALSTGDKITARAQAPGKCTGADSNEVIVN